MLSAEGGRPVILENRGGETHTFTMVAKFGGGFIPKLDELSDNPVPRDECAAPGPDGTLISQPASSVNVFVDAGKEMAFSSAGLKPGRNMFQCCFHPRMRVILTVK